MRVEVVHWNPRVRRRPGVAGFLLPRKPSPNNFGDLLGPLIVERLVEASGRNFRDAERSVRLLAVGSIIRMARSGDIVWGAGVNGKSLNDPFNFTSLDVRAVRGPLTRDFLIKKNIEVPDVFGDPGLLVGELWPREDFLGDGPMYPLTVVPNLNDSGRFPQGPEFLHPSDGLRACMSRIARSEFVTGSSLHAIVLAESWGIPARLIRSASEPDFKYEDYYLGSGRDGFAPAATVRSAIEMGGEPNPKWSSKTLTSAFPYELWARRRSGVRSPQVSF